MDWAAQSLQQHETVELFGAAGCGGVGGSCAWMSEYRGKKVEITAISGCFHPKSVKYVQNLEIEDRNVRKFGKFFISLPVALRYQGL